MATQPPANPLPKPRRGEIWFIRLASDPPDKGPRPIVIVSPDGRNQHPRATSVLAVPLSTTLSEHPWHVRLSTGDTGLEEASEARGENITVVVKKALIPAKVGLRTLNAATLRRIAAAVVRGMGVLPEELK